MPALLILLVIVAAVIVFEFAAQRWGYDSRDDFRFGGDGFRFTRR